MQEYPGNTQLPASSFLLPAFGGKVEAGSGRTADSKTLEESKPLRQASETLRQLHQRLVDNVGSEGVAQAIEGGVALFVVLLILIYLRGRFSKAARRRRSAGKRFRELARANALPAGDRQMLLAMARHLDLDEPGLLFVRRSYFEEAVEKGNFKPERVDVLRRELYS